MEEEPENLGDYELGNLSGTLHFVDGDEEQLVVPEEPEERSGSITLTAEFHSSNRQFDTLDLEEGTIP